MCSRNKLVLFFGYSSLFPFILIAVIAHMVSYTSCKRQSQNQLISLTEAKKREIEDFFTSIKRQIGAISEDRFIVEATRYFSDNGPYFTSVPLSPLSERHYRLEKRNRFSAGSILNNQEKKEYQHFITEHLKRFGNYEIFIAEPYSGKIVFTNSQELNFSISLLIGPYSNINFGKSFQLAKKCNNPNYVIVTDFEHIPPSYNRVAGFISSPIYDGSKKVGVLIGKIPIDEITSIVSDDHNRKGSGVGKSGKIYIVGKDLTLRSFSQAVTEKGEGPFAQVERTDIHEGILNTMNAMEKTKFFQRVESRGVREAVSGETSVGMFSDYRSVPVMSAYTPLEIEGLHWGIVSEIDQAEVFASVYLMRNYSFVIGSVYFIILTTALICYISKEKQRRLQEREECVKQIPGKSILVPNRMRPRNFDTVESKAGHSAAADLNFENVEKTSDFLQRCNVFSEREDRLTNECIDVMNEIKSTIAKQSEQIYHICDTTQHAIYGQEDRYNSKRTKKVRQADGLMDRSDTKKPL